jgi:diguanylate cyclase (GGDEF)-like protein
MGDLGMVILYDSFLSVLLFALSSCTVAQLLYYKGDDGYVIGRNAPFITLGWLGLLPAIIYRDFKDIMYGHQVALFWGPVILIAGVLIAYFYSCQVLKNKSITAMTFIRNVLVVAIVMTATSVFEYDTHILKTCLMVLTLILGAVLVIVQTHFYKNRIGQLWIFFLSLSELLLLGSLFITGSDVLEIKLFFQGSGTILYMIALGINYNDTINLTSTKKINELEQQNRRLFEAEVQVLKYAYKDQVTNLPNYSSFHSTLSNLLNSRKFEVAHLLYLDLDDFRRVNTVVGFAEGNEILRAAGDLITSVMPGRDKLFRINGSRYALIHFGSVHSSQTLACDVIGAINEAEELRTNIYFKQGVSIGITEIENGKDFNTIVNQAEIAMYKVKEYRKNDFEYFNELHEREYKNLLELEGKLKNATRENVWTVYLQPQVNVDSNEVQGLEALIRWFDGEKYIPPNEFIPLAEKNGLIVNIGDDVIQKVFGLMRDCRDKKNETLKFSINISAVEIFDPSFVKRMKGYIESYDINPENLTLELTETSILENVEEAQAVLTELRALNIAISIDDFGSGYTSLYYLSKLPIDEVKIDKSFIDNVLVNDKDRIMLGHFTNLCHDLGLRVVAEGVETKEQLEYVREIGCDLYQGYYFSKPMSYEHICDSIGDFPISQTS